MTIDLRSDTVTKPTEEMLETMLNAEVGDDVLGEDPTVDLLERKVAKMFAKEAALYCPSGTMTNQIAIKVHTQPGDEVICHRLSHIYVYEGGGIAVNSGASVRLVDGNRGRFRAQDVLDNLNPEHDVHFPRTTVVGIENTCNKGGGCCWDLNEIKKVSRVCHENNLKLHLDGARIFNALAVTGESPQDHGKQFDSISICLSKGLGAPVGSVLLGATGFILRARRVRKFLGGGMRQAGYMAAAGIYALENNIDRLSEDHDRAKRIEDILKSLPYVKEVIPVETNIVQFRLTQGFTDKVMIEKLATKGIRASIVDSGLLRFVTHLQFTDDMIDKLENTLRSM